MDKAKLNTNEATVDIIIPLPVKEGQDGGAKAGRVILTPEQKKKLFPKKPLDVTRPQVHPTGKKGK